MSKRSNGTVWFRKDRNVWVAEYQGRRASARSELEARDLLVQLRTGQSPTRQGPAQRTVGNAIDAWLDSKRDEGDLVGSTLKDYEQVARDYLVPLRTIELADLQPHHIKQVIAQFEKRVGGGRILRTLRQALTYARAMGWIDRDPTEVIKARKRAPMPTVIADERIAAAAAAVKGDRLQTFLVVKLALGLSAGEVYGLCWDKVDFDKSLVHIHRVKRKVEGIEDFPKNSSRYRTLHAPDVAREALQHQKAMQDRWRSRHPKTWKEHPLHPVFTTELGDPLNDSAQAHRFRDLQERAGITEPLRLKDMRSAHATIAYGEHQIERVAEQLGHADTRTTKRHYAAVTPRTSKDYATEMDAAIRRALGIGDGEQAAAT